MSVSVLGKRYARALFGLGQKASVTERMSRELQDFVAAWEQSRELRTAFENPSIGQSIRHAILRDIAVQAGMHEHVRDLLLLLSDRRRLRHIPEVAEAFEAMQQASSGVIRAEVTTASELPDAYFNELQATLKQVTGRDVVIARKTDSTLIGGVVTRIGDHVFDGSLKYRLSELEDELLQA
jgi:F-type H+-transporting ATPase subunit delta